MCTYAIPLTPKQHIHKQAIENKIEPMLLSPSPAPANSPVTISPPPPLVVVTSPPSLPPIAPPFTSPPSPPTSVVVLPPTSSVPPLPPPATSTPPVTSPPLSLPEAPTLPVVAPPPIATPISPVTSPPSPPEPLKPPVTSPLLPTTPLAPANSPQPPPISPSPQPSLAPKASPSPPWATLSAPVTPPSPPPPSSSIVRSSPPRPNDPTASALASPPPPLSSSSITPPQTPNSWTSPPPTRPLPAIPKQSHLPTGLIVTGGTGVVLLLLVLGLLCICYRNRKKREHSPSADYHKPQSLGPKDNSSSVLPQLSQQNVPPPGSHVITVVTLTSSNERSGSINIQSENPIQPQSPGVALGFSSGHFTYDELVVATNGFSDANLLGQGGFGYVHKGVLPNGKEVAVKQLKEKSGQGEREFQAEVETISRVHHKHLVSLVGYCITGAERLLIYEFLPNNTLEYHLHGKGQPVMSWATRLKIAIGCAKGLAYLHEDCNPTIIHRDIKAANILLDYKFEAKVSDFGLAKFFSDTNIGVTHISTRVVGTFGYLAPEYAASGKVTDKSDVYSYGVMLLELITGRPPISTSESLMKEGLVEWARPLLTQALEAGNFNALVDPRLEGNYNISEVASMVVCAGACVRHSAWLRPQMSQIVRALEGDVPLKDFSKGIRPGHSLMYGYKDDIKKFNLLLGNQQSGISAFSGTTSEYGLNPSGSSSDDSRQTEV